MTKDTVNIQNYTDFSVHVDNNKGDIQRFPVSSFQDAVTLLEALMLSQSSFTIRIMGHEWIDKTKNLASGCHTLLSTSWMIVMEDSKFTRESDWMLLQDKIGFKEVWNQVQQKAKHLEYQS